MATNQPMTLDERVAVLIALGKHLQRMDDDYLRAVMHRTHYHNDWFTIENQEQAIRAIADQMLDAKQLQQWLQHYHIDDHIASKAVALVPAGNIPLVSFHDVLCIFAAGHRAIIKLSDKEPYLLPYLLQWLQRFDPRSAAYFQIVEKLQNYDAVIATGSNNSARYFEAYFGKVPHIIRRNRNGVALIEGQETPQQLQALGHDVFSYFGLGCRNVSKLYVPRTYDFQPLLEALYDFRSIILHNRYKNNFDYNYALYILNRIPHHANGCILLMEDASLQSRIAVLHYAYYDTIEQVVADIAARESEIQCVVASDNQHIRNAIPFGTAQQPTLSDYADGVDTMQFLLSL
jgi:hypothetical protein